MGLRRYVVKDVHPKVAWKRAAVTICAHVGKMPTRNLDLFRDVIEGEKNLQRC